MPFRSRHGLGAVILALLVTVVVSVSTALAQQSARNAEGFDITLDTNVTGGELTVQPNLWVMEVSFKPMRMIWVDIPDPETGETTRELVWYLVYRAVNRPLPEKEQAEDVEPVNTFDEPPTPIFVPEFTLVTEDEGNEQVYQDVISPAAEQAILRRERRELKNPVDVIADLPPLTPEEEGLENAIYGLAIWRGVDPETDYFTVYMTGFSSGYREGENDVVFRRTIMQEYWRPGDSLDESENEIRRRSEPRWIYRVDEPQGAIAAESQPEPAADAPSN